MVNQYCAHSFARNWQLPFLNQRKGENDRRKYFMINLHERMLPTSAGVEPATSWSPVGRRIQFSHRGRRGAYLLIFTFDLEVKGKKTRIVHNNVVRYLWSVPAYTYIWSGGEREKTKGCTSWYCKVSVECTCLHSHLIWRWKGKGKALYLIIL